MTYARQSFWKPRGIAGRVLSGSLLFLLLVLLYFIVFGLPPWLVDTLMSRVRTETFALQADVVHISLWGRVSARNVRVYRKGLVGPPAVEAGRVTLNIDPLAVPRGKPWVRRVRVDGGTLRPDFLFDSETREGGRPPLLNQAMIVELRRCRVDGIDVTSARADVRGEGASLTVRNLRATLAHGDRHGEVEGSLQFDFISRCLKGRLTTDLDPHVLLPVLSARRMTTLDRLIGQFDFGPPPRVEVEFERSVQAQGPFSLSADFKLKEAVFRGVGLLRADGKLRVDLGCPRPVVVIDPLLVVRREGIASGGVTIYIREHLVDFHGESSMDPKAVFQMLNLFQSSAVLADCAWKAPVNVASKGSVAFGGDLNRTDFDAVVQGREWRYKKWHVENFGFTMAMRGPTNQVTDVRGRAYGGEVSGTCTVVLATGSVSHMAYRLDGDLRDAEFRQVLDAVSSSVAHTQDATGRTQLSLGLSGLLGAENLGSMHGEGRLRVEDGQVLRLPLFGGLSRYMGRLIPGLDFVMRQTDAKVDFAIADSRVTAERISVLGDVLSLSGHGTCHFDGRLDFDVQVKLMKEHTLVAKLVRGITWPISKLFEFRLQGTVAHPDWQPFSFPAYLLEKIGIGGEDKPGDEKPRGDEPSAEPGEQPGEDEAPR